MSSIIKLLKTIRNHWKKTTFAACAVTYGANYAKESYEIQTLMENYCKQALNYGMQPLQPSENPRKVLIILNPTANRRKAVKQFEKYCVPILHLAGICVDVVQTKSEGHARTLLQEHRDKTDAIIIAGGDGTLSEGVTGILRRDDSRAFLEGGAIGVLPLGRQNTFARAFFHHNNGTTDTVEQVRRLADASLAIVKEQRRRADVLRIETRANDDETATSAAAAKPVFALTGVEWGSYRDAHAKLDKYWYFGRLRKYAAYVFNGYKANLSWECAADVAYFPPCSGCSNCYKITEQPEHVPGQQSGRWWNSFVQKNNAAPQKPPNEAQFVLNENCAKLTTDAISTSDFKLTVNGDVPELVVSLGPKSPDISYWGFVQEGCAAEDGAERTTVQTINARQIDVTPKAENQANAQFYSIDNEEFEVKPIRVTLLPKLIQFYCLD